MSDSYAEECEAQALVFDVGTAMTKAGFAGDDAPRAVFPTIVGRARHTGVGVGMYTKDAYIGDEAQAKRGILTLNFPLQRGVVNTSDHHNNWRDMEKVWHHSFYNELCVQPEEHALIYSMNVKSTQLDEQKVTQIMFETFNIPALNLSAQSVLGLYATGKVNGLVIDSGAGSTRIVPVYEGHALKHAVSELQIGGKDITQYLLQILNGEKGFDFRTSAEREIVRDIKEKLTYVALDYDTEIKEMEAQNSADLKAKDEYELPDGQVIHIGDAMIKCTEILFQPALCGMDVKGIHELALESIDKVVPNKDVMDGRKLETNLLSNVALVGGSSCFPGLQKRLQLELTKAASTDLLRSNIKVNAAVYRKYSVWIGASIVGICRSFMETMCIDKDMYDEYGPTFVHLRSFGTILAHTKSQETYIQKRYGDLVLHD